MPLTEIVLKSFSIINTTILTGVISTSPYNISTNIEPTYKDTKFSIKSKSLLYQDKKILQGNTSMFLKLDTKRKRGSYIGIRVDLY